MRRTVFANAGLTAASLRRWRFRLVVFFVRIWFLRAWRRRTLPVPVRRKRFAAPRWDLSLGTACVSPNRDLAPPRISINRNPVGWARLSGRGKDRSRPIHHTAQSPTPAKVQPRSAPIRASVHRLQIVERQPSVVLAQLLLQYEVLPRKAREHGADPGLRAQRGAATGGAVGNGLRGSGRRNGVTAERRQLTGESAGRGVPESARGRNTALRGLRDTAGKALGTHARCPKHPETGLVTARCGKSLGWPG